VKLIFAEQAWEDYVCWQQQDKRMVKLLDQLIEHTMQAPFTGLGKPEPLKHALSGFWSRRITDEHRMVYMPDEDALLMAQLRYFHRALWR